MTIFQKIFLCFTLAFALSILATMLLMPWQGTPPLVILWRNVASSALELYANQMAVQFEAEGAAAASRIADSVRQRYDIHLSLLDSQGRLLAGDAPPANADAIAVPAVGDFPRNPNSPLLASFTAQGRSGREYRVLALIPGPLLEGRPPPPPRDFDVRRFAILVFVSGMICYLLAKYLTVPLVRLRRAAQKLGSGDLSARVPVIRDKSKDEVFSLVQAFNRMAEQLESLVKAQRRLLSDVSHELRSPLARLSVALDIARRKSEAPVQPALDRIELEAKRLDDLIGEILHLSQLESSATDTEKEEVDLQGFIREVAEDADFEARDKNSRVRCGEMQDCSVAANRELLRRAVENVLRNAVSYTESGSDVLVNLQVETDARTRVAVLTVQDHGPGVPAEELAHIFEPFYRVGDDRSRKTGGTGLGLAITARAIQLHGGSVKATNAEGGGLIITVAIPCQS